MDTLKQQLAKIQQQLGGLSASQKMLTASLAAIMVMTFIWWGKYAGTSEMTPVFNQSLSAEDLQRVKQVLSSENISFDMSGDKVLVPTEKKESAIAALAYAQALPKDSSGSYEDFFSKMSPFTSPSLNDKEYNEYLQAKIQGYIGMWKGVGEVSLLIDPSSEHVIGANVEPSASVSVQMRNGSGGSKELATAIARFVAGSNAHMRPSRVTVLINGRVYPIHEDDPNLPDGEINEQAAKEEARYAEKIKEALGQYGSNVIAVVHAKIDPVSSHKSATSYPKITAKEKSTESDTSNSTSPAQGAEPGAVPNSGTTLAVGQQGGTEGPKTETDHEKGENAIFADQTTTEEVKPPGESKALSATVSLPRTTFVQELKQADPSAKQPAAKDVEALFAQRKPDIVASVMNAVGIEDQNQVSIVLGPDAPMLLAVAENASSGSSSSAASSITGHVKEIAVGLLAIVSLFMVSMMVKKSTPTPVVEAAVEFPEPIRLGGNIDIAGEVGEGGQALDGMELDDDAIKSKQMVDQVSTMVKENPDAAATMVKRWLNRS
jgi:flagellar biosynthesis/type III secretory pathway M-ring protein FliF/YscJ